MSYDTVDIDVFELKVDDNELKDIEFGRVFIDKDSVITVRIYNRDAASFAVSDIRFTNNNVFSHVNILPETVVAGGYIDVKIKFSPADIITYNDSIQVLITEPCKITLTGNVSGTGIVKLIASLPDTTGEIGDIDFCIPLSAYFETNRNISNQSNWTAYISHDAALFAPNASISSAVINGIRHSTMQGNSTVQNNQIAISDYCGMILLDQKISTVLELDSLNYQNPNVLVELNNGSLTTNGICVRNLSQIARLEKIQLKLMKNPADDKIIFEVSVPNSENISIQLYNFAGIEERQSSITRRFEKGSYRIEMDSELLVDGIYFLRLSTLDDVITEKIILYKR